MRITKNLCFKIDLNFKTGKFLIEKELKLKKKQARIKLMFEEQRSHTKGIAMTATILL